MDKILNQVSKEKIEQIVQESNSFVEVTSKLELNSFMRKNVERTIKRLNISVQHFDSIQKLQNKKTRYTKDKLLNLVKTCKNYKEILIELDILPISTNYNTLRKKLNEYEIDFSHLKNQRSSNDKTKWTKDNLEKIVGQSKNQMEVLEKLGLRLAGGNFNTLRKYLVIFELNTSHFTKDYEIMRELKLKNKIPLEDILIENSTYDRGHLKDRLYSEGLKERKCELCGQGEEWQGKKMSLILDHKNGIHNDNRLENLRIACPNCNATLDTHCGKNIKKDIKVKINHRIEYNVNRRIVERPSFDILKNEIELFGLEGTGRKYNVTGNSIKKWVKTYEKYGK